MKINHMAKYFIDRLKESWYNGNILATVFLIVFVGCCVLLLWG